MKKFRKLTSAIAALTLVASLAIPSTAMFTAFAGDNDGDDVSQGELKNEDGDEGDEGDDNPAGTKSTVLDLAVGEGLGIKNNTVYATKIFKLTFAAGKNEAQTIEWADGVSTDIKDALKKVTGVTTGVASDVAIKIAEAGAEKVAKALAAVVGANGTAGTYADGKVTFTNGLDDGYYLFTAIGTKAVLDGTAEAMSLGMLSIVNGAATGTGAVGNGTAKIGLPTVEKKVLEDDHDEEAEDADTATYEEDNAHWNDNADLDIGQEAKFGLYGTLPENYDKYDTYYYEFVDTLDGVFEEPDKTNFTVEISGVTDDLEEGEDYTIEIDGNEEDGWSINVVFENLKDINGVTSASVITVKYTTVLTDRAEAGKANLNEVKLKYSNNPNKSGSGDNETGETPEDRVAVYTYDFKFEKTFWNANSDLTADEILAGKYTGLRFGFNGNLKFRKTTDEDEFRDEYDYVVVPDDYEDNENPAVTSFELTLIDENEDRVTSTDGMSIETAKKCKLVVRIKGLDSGEYQLTETTTGWSNFGYGELAAKEGTFTLESGIELTQTEDEFDDIESLWSNDTLTDQDDYLEIQNRKGTSLPSTGGIGTTLFYVVGGALVTVAGVTLITKKRVGDAE